jgi:hypothetical protein
LWDCKSRCDTKVTDTKVVNKARKIKAIYVGTPDGLKPLRHVYVGGIFYKVKIEDGVLKLEEEKNE